MKIRADNIGADLKELVFDRINKEADKNNITVSRAINVFALDCEIQPQRMGLWLNNSVEFRQSTLERIGKQLNINK